jgi:class I lanthipeptide synthase
VYRYVDAVVLRTSAWPRDSLRPAAPALPAASHGWCGWLTRVLAIPGFVEAMEHASPVLVDRARAARDGRELSERQARRIALAVLRYLLRARSRATPFGLFAGVAPARLAEAGTIRIGRAHRPVARVPADWLRTVAGALERDPVVWPHLLVQANTLMRERDGRLVLPYRANECADGSPGHVVVRATRPVRAAMAAAKQPIVVSELVCRLCAEFGVDAATVDRLLAGLVEQQLLVTHLRPAMTDTDPLDALVHTAATTLNIQDGGRPALLDVLEAARRAKIRHDRPAGPGSARSEPRELSAALGAAAPFHDAQVGLDLCLDADLALPRIVAADAARAAAVLARLAPASATAAWRDWHGRFLERYGPHALVPAADAVDPDVGLGMPAGYRDTAPTPPASLTERDINLVVLAQEAALRGQRDVVLDDAAVTALAGPDTPAHVQPSVEVRVRVEASSLAEIQRGNFGLNILGVYRTAGTTTARFTDLFDEASRTRMTAVYLDLPTLTRGAVRAQISAPLPYTATEAVARSAQMLPYLVPLGECRPVSAHHIPLDDLAVTADPQRLYLVWLSQRRIVEPVMLNAVEAARHMLPLARFLSEAPTALDGPCLPFLWGPAASRLPFLPALRYGRCLLSPARWLLHPSRLPVRRAAWREWSCALEAWRAETGCPARVHLGATDQRIELDLDQPAHRALLRAQLDRGDPANLTAAGPADGDAWIGGHAHDIAIPLAATTAPVPAPCISPPVVTVRDHGRLPGDTRHLFLKIYGHPDQQHAILTGHLPRLLDELGAARCWFLRYRDPNPHLRIRLTDHTDHAEAALAAVAAWTRQLRAAGLTARTQLDTDYPETTRFGGPDALPAAEDFFAADSAAVLAHLAALDAAPTLDARALTAASLLDLATGAFDHTAEAMRWLTSHTTSQPTPPDRSVYRQALSLAAPDGITTITASVGCDILPQWHQRRAALRTYRQAATAVPVDTLLADLLHLHHVRAIGPDRDSERACLHLARAAALSWLARHGGTRARTTA